MSKVFINSGHCVGIDSGAVNTVLGVTEAELVKEIGEMVRDELEERGIEVYLEQSNNIKGEDGQNWYDSICYHANDWDADIAVSLHLNAFDKTKSGTECWYISDKGRLLASNIQKELVETLELQDRGVRFSADYWFLRYTDMPAIIVEIAFIDNTDDCVVVIDMKEDIAKAIADGIEDYFY